ncbi:MAG: type II secretion system F family protein, partial [Candidatus Acidiferrales bacterium]
PEDDSFAKGQRKKLERLLEGFANLFPTAGGNQTNDVRLLVRAGYHRPEAVRLLRGAKIFLPVLLIAALGLSGLYKVNPIFIFLLAGVGGYLAPDFWLTRRVKGRQRKIVRGMPDALDLLVVCVEAGMGLDQAVFRVSKELAFVHPELSDELQLVTLEMRLGKNRTESLRDLADRTGVEDIRSLVAMLIQTDRFGTDVAQSLRVQSQTLRTQRRQRAEENAARTTIKMIPPLVFFIFPALFAVLLGPAVISLVREFGKSMGN